MKQTKLFPGPDTNSVKMGPFFLLGLKTNLHSSIQDLSEYHKVRQCWQNFNMNLRQIKNRIHNKNWVKFGALLQNFDIAEETLEYIACVKVKNLDSIPPNMWGISMPSTKMGRNSHQGYLKDFPLAISSVLTKIPNKEKKDKVILYNSHRIPEYRKILLLERYDRRFHWNDKNSIIEFFNPL